MVVLARDPLQDLRDTNTIRYMMKNGELFEGDTLNEVGPREKPWLHCGGGTISPKSPCLSRVGSRVTALAAGRGNFSEKQREGGTRAPRPRRYLALVRGRSTRSAGVAAQSGRTCPWSEPAGLI